MNKPLSINMLMSLAFFSGAAWLAGAVMNFGTKHFTDLAMRRVWGYWPSHRTRWTAGALLIILLTFAFDFALEALSINLDNSPTTLLLGWLVGFTVTSWRIINGAGPAAGLVWQHLTSLRMIVAASVIVTLLAVTAHYVAIESATTWRYDFSEASERHEKRPLTLGYGYLAAAGSISRSPFGLARVQPVGDDYAKLCSLQGSSSSFFTRAGSANGQVVLIRYSLRQSQGLSKVGPGEKIVLPERFYAIIEVDSPDNAILICD